MAGHRLQRALLLIAAIVSQGSDGDGVSCDTPEVKEASIGKEFTLHCSVGCPNGPYQWFNYTGQQALDLPDSGENLMVSEKVESAAAVGGQRYACRCEATGATKCYIVWVTPYVKLNVSKEVVKLGSSVTITCSAESYPPANSVDFFQLQHPAENDIPRDNLTLVGTSVVYHVLNVSRSDGGEYDCVVSVYESSDGEHSQNQSQTTLTVYDPPVINETRSSAVSNASGGEPVVLECIVENAEPMLDVWVNWTTGGGSDPLVGGDYSVGKGMGGVYFLVLHRVTRSYSYTCQLFSMYSPKVSEDNKTVEIKFQRHTNTSELKGNESDQCQHWKIALAVALPVVVTVAIIICSLVVVVHQRKIGKKTYSTQEVAYSGSQEEVHIEPEVGNSAIDEQHTEVQRDTTTPKDVTVDVSTQTTDFETTSEKSTSTSDLESQVKESSETDSMGKGFTTTEKSTSTSDLESQVKESSETDSMGKGFTTTEKSTSTSDLESQVKESSETDSMGKGFSPSLQTKRSQNGRRPSLPKGRRRSSSTSSYRKSSGPEGESLISDNN